MQQLFFFARFGSQDYKESATNTSTIDLEHIAAVEAFPILLDIIYWQTLTLDSLSPAVSLALYHLLEFFQVDGSIASSIVEHLYIAGPSGPSPVSIATSSIVRNSIASLIEDFWEENMEGEDCAEWYECAQQFRNDKR